MGKRAIKKSTYQKVKDQLNLPYKKKKLSKSEKRNNIRKEFETENVIIKSSSKTKDICLSKAQKNFSIEKRFKLKPLKSLFIKPNKDINKMTLDELKQFAHKNDLIPEVNFKLLLSFHSLSIILPFSIDCFILSGNFSLSLIISSLK